MERCSPISRWRPAGRRGLRAGIVGALACLLLPVGASAAPIGGPSPAAACQFVLGFATLHGLIPKVVGTCLEDERHNPANGDALQQTTGGLLVWRKADNWTAFTDGYHAWINGPNGLAERLNTQRFSWEANPENLPLADAALPPISVRQPRPNDLVGASIVVAGVGTGFEGRIAARVRDANGRVLATAGIDAGGTGIWGDFVATLTLSGAPPTPAGTVEVYEPSAKDSSPLHLVTVPVVFGPALLSSYHGFAKYTVAAGDTLAAIARRWYGDASAVNRLIEANRPALNNPSQLVPGQVLRIPQ